jgi:TPR repeat protein
MYANGTGVATNETEAVRLYRLASDQGYAPAQNNLGAMYKDGRGVRKNDAESVRLFRLAADQGYANAQYNIGLMYADGTGVKQNYVQAYAWLNIAFASGNAAAISVRDKLRKKMTRQDIEAAQILSSNWMKK